MPSIHDLLKKKAENSSPPNSVTASPIQAAIAEAKPAPVAAAPTPPVSPIKAAMNRFGKKTTAGGENAVTTTGKPQVPSKTQEVSSVRPAVPSPVTPVQQAMKEVAKDLSRDTLEDLKNNLAFLAENIEHVDLVRQAVRTVAGMLAQNPQFASQLPMQREDFNLLIKGLRKSHRVAARKKNEKTEKKAVFNADVAEVEELLKSLEF